MGHRSARLVGTLVAATTALVALIATAAPPAQAHAELTSTQPSAARPLDHCPRIVTLRFDEAVATNGLEVSINAHPATILSSDATSRVFTVGTAGVCPAASLALSWRTVSADDGHVATNVVTFHVHTSDTATSTTSDHTGPAGGPALAVFRAVSYAALALLVGGLFFLIVLWPEGAEVRRAQRLLWLAAILGLAGSIGGLWATTQRAGGMSLSLALNQPFGREYAALGALWLLTWPLVVDVRQRGRGTLTRLGWRVSCVVVGGAIVVVESMTAHAFASSHRALGLADDVVHVTAMSIWIGGLPMLTLCVLPRRRLAELERVVARFSAVAKTSIGAAIASGLVLLALVVVPAHHFWGTRYAATLGLKLAVLAVALLVAAGSERWVRTHRREARVDDARSVAAIAASVGLETALALMILVAAGALSSSSPGV